MAVLITLISDKRADDDDILPDEGGYKGGWWGDDLPFVPGDLIGWKGWLLRRSKAISTVIAEAEDFLRDGFQWMFDDGIIEDLEINVVRDDKILDMGSSVLLISLKFVRPGKQDVFFQYHFNWESQLLRSATNAV